MKKYLLKVWMTAALSLMVIMGVWGQESYTTGFPNVSDITHDSATLNVSASVGGTVRGNPTHYTLFVILEATETAPTIQNVIDWSYDANGGLIPDGRYGEIALLAANTAFDYMASGLDPETNYVAYFVTTENDYATVVIETVEPTDVPFTTTGAPAPLTATLSPLDNAADVSIGTSTFVLTFSEDIEFTGVENLYAGLYEGGSSVEGQLLSTGNNNVVIDNLNNTLSITFGHSLEYNTEYYITIPGNAIQSVATEVVYAGLSAGEWSFTTEAQPFTLDSQAPADGAVDVALDVSLVATFSENIQLGTSAEVHIFNYETDGLFETVSGAGLSVSGSELTIDPTTEFAEGTRYYVVIPAGAVETTGSVPFAGLTDKDAWDFTTLYLSLENPVLTPANSATGIARDAMLSLQFDKDIELGFGTIGIYKGGTQEKLFDASSPAVSIISNNTLQIDLFSNALDDYATVYDVRIASTFIKRNGIDVYFSGFAANEWSFTTEAEPFTLDSQAPADGAVDVALDASLVATFSENIQLGTSAEVHIYNYETDGLFETVSGAGLSVSGSDLTIDPTTDFAEGTRYYVVIPAGAVETTGSVPFAGLADKDAWDFTTLFLPPTVASFDPDGLSPIAVDKVLNLTFDRPVKLNDSGMHAIRIRKYSDESPFYTYVIDGADTDPLLSVSGDVLTITPPVNYESNTQYYVEISADAVLSLNDIAFSGITTKDVWIFTTETAVAAPEIATGGYSPTPGQTEVSRNPVLELTFNENIVKGNSGYFRIFRSSNDEELFVIPRTNSQVVVTDNVLTVSLTNITLDYFTEYYVLIDPGFVKSSASGVDFPGISSSAEWYFITETAPPFWATDYPSVTSQNAVDFTFNGQTDQNGDFYFVITGTGIPAPDATQISLGLNGSGAAAKIAYSGTMTANTPMSDIISFNEATSQGDYYYLYAVAISGGKASEVVRVDLDRTAPFVVPGMSYPSNGATTVPVDAEISIVFSEMVYGFVDPGVEPIDGTDFSIKAGEVEIPFTFAVSANGEVVTLTPSSSLTENTTYTITIQPIADAYGNSTSIITRTFETDKLNQWVGGGVVSDWSDPLNWSDGNFVSGKSVIVTATATAFPVIDDEAVGVYNLTVEAGAAVTLTGGTLDITGILNLQSSSDINASFIKTGGTLYVEPADVQVDQVVSVSNETYIISSPVSDVTKASLGATDRMFTYDNTTDSFVEFASGTMEIGVGYLARSTQDLVFRGAFNEGDVTANATYTEGAGYGWNMVGNPYPAAVNWETITKSIEIENAIWIWKHFEGVYGTYSSESGVSVNITDPWIPSNHGFFIKVKSAYSFGSITFKPSDMGINTTSYLKSGSMGNAMPHFKLAGVKGSRRDEAAVILSSEATSGVDRFDAQKYFSNSSKVLEVYTLAGGMKSAINGVPYTENMEVALGYSAPVAGAYSFEMVHNSLENVKVLLLDKSNGNVTDMTSGGSYEFNVSAAGKNQSRFVLKFIRETTTSANETSVETSFKVFSADHQIFVQVPYSENKFEYELSDISGRLIERGLLSNDLVNAIPVQSTGTYVVSVKGTIFDEVKHYKVVVH